MTPQSRIRTGAIGSVVAAICCFTPLLVIALPAIGLAAWLNWIDIPLFAALAGFLTMLLHGLYLRRAAGKSAPK